MTKFGFPIETVLIFLSVVSLSVFIDLFVHRRTEDITILNASFWSVLWITLALAFYGYVWWSFGKQWADLYLTGVVLEKSLSIDNLIVFTAIFSSFSIKKKLQHKILYWGIIGALIFRAIFVAIGTELLYATSWIGFIFATIVAWSGWKMLVTDSCTSPVTDYMSHWSVKLTKRIIPIYPYLYNENFFVTRNMANQQSQINVFPTNKPMILATPAFLCLIAIEASDIVFAFDSVPVIVTVTPEPLLAYAAMIFAILGLRSLYFILSVLDQYCKYLKKATIILLFFISFKLVLESIESTIGLHVVYISPNTNLIIVLCTLATSVIASYFSIVINKKITIITNITKQNAITTRFRRLL